MWLASCWGQAVNSKLEVGERRGGVRRGSLTWQRLGAGARNWQLDWIGHLPGKFPKSQTPHMQTWTHQWRIFPQISMLQGGVVHHELVIWAFGRVESIVHACWLHPHHKLPTAHQSESQSAVHWLKIPPKTSTFWGEFFLNKYVF